MKTDSYEAMKAADQKLKEEYRSHPAAINAFWNASGFELKELCDTWDKIKAYGVPEGLINDMFSCGYSAGRDDANFDDGENG